MKKLDFVLKTNVGPFIPYKDFYWHRQWPQLVSMSFHDYFSDSNSSVTFTGSYTAHTQSLALFASQLAYNTIKTGVEAPFPIRTSSSRNYSNAYVTSSTIPSTNLFQASDYIEPSALYDETKLPDNFYMGNSYTPETIHTTDTTASFKSFKTRGYRPQTKMAWNNAKSEIQRFYQGKNVENYGVIKSNKKSDCPNCKFRIKRSLRDSSGNLRDISLCVSIASDYMPTTNFDMIGPFPWLWSLPYGGLGQHTTDLFSGSVSSYNTSSFEANNATRLLRSKLNVPDERTFKFTFDVVSDGLEELSFQEFLITASSEVNVKSLELNNYANTKHVMPFDKYFEFGVDKDDYPYIAIKSENITALLNPDHSSATTISAMSGSITTNVPNTAPISPYISNYDNNKGIWLKIYDCGDGNISAAELFGLEGKVRIGGMQDDLFLEEAILAVPLIQNEFNTAEPIKLDRETVLDRMKFLQKDGQLRFNYFKDKELDGIVLNRDSDKSDDPNAVDDYILASEKYVFPPEFDVIQLLKDKTWTPFFGVVFEFTKKITRCDRLSLWQGVLTDNILSSEVTEQTITVPIELFGPNFKFDEKTIRVMLLRVKKRAETNYEVWRSKLLNLDYRKEDDLRISYNYPYDEFTILPASELVARVYCKEDEQ